MGGVQMVRYGFCMSDDDDSSASSITVDGDRPVSMTHRQTAHGIDDTPPYVVIFVQHLEQLQGVIRRQSEQHIEYQLCNGSAFNVLSTRYRQLDVPLNCRRCDSDSGSTVVNHSVQQDVEYSLRSTELGLHLYWSGSLLHNYREHGVRPNPRFMATIASIMALKSLLWRQALLSASAQ